MFPPNNGRCSCPVKHLKGCQIAEWLKRMDEAFNPPNPAWLTWIIDKIKPA